MMNKRRLRYCVTLIVLFLAVSAWSREWKGARPDYEWSFPEDHWARAGYKTEWWYFTGHLESKSGRRFGYQFTIFRVGLLPERLELLSDWTTENLFMGHAAIGDFDSGRHHFSEVLYRAVPLLAGFGTYPDSTIAWSRGPAGTAGSWKLTWNGNGFDFEMQDRKTGIAFTLSTEQDKPIAFQGPNGYSRKGESPTAASQYYSLTRLKTQGTISIGEQTVPVRGESWMDKEFGSNQLETHQAGWDWFSLQLSDGRDVMLYSIRDKSGKVDFSRGTLIGRQGEIDYVSGDQVSVEVIETWRSSETGAAYPSRWRIVIEGVGLELNVEPEIADQENRSWLVPGLFYWEGAVRVMDRNGVRIGRGYTELVGYGGSILPAI